MDRSFALPLPSRLPTLALPRRRAGLALGGVLLALALLGGGWLLLRNSPLVAVEHVKVHGARGPESHAIEMALEEAARGMSTLNVNVGALRAAVATFHVVRDLRVSTGFPHSLSISVVEQPPVAALVVDGSRTAVAADGAVLGEGLLSSSLPTVPGATGDSLGVGHVHSTAALAALTVLDAAPPALVGWVARVYEGHEGLTVAMRNGLLLYFGDATRAHAKWLAAARVLADSSSAGAWYVDVRLPERPAAGLSGGPNGEGASPNGSASGQVSASDPTAAALAATLAEAVSGAPAIDSNGSGAASSTETAAPGGASTSLTETYAPAGASTGSYETATPGGAPTSTTEAAPGAAPGGSSTAALGGASSTPSEQLSPVPAGKASGG